MTEMEDLLDGLQHTPNLLSAMVASIPQSKLDRRRGQGFWTIAEHVSHLAQVQPMLLARLERFVHETHPEFVPYIPGQGDDSDGRPQRMQMDSALVQFKTIRDGQTALLAGIDVTVWQKAATHPEYEHYSLHILVRHILMHDFWHMYRMEELWLTRDSYLTN